MEKQIRTKNYIILAVLIIVTVLAVFYARSWYITTKEYYAVNSIMLDTVSEIQPNELANYTLENPKFTLYVSSGQNSNIKEFEEQFQKNIIDQNLSSSIIYLNADNISQADLTKELQSYAENDQVKKRINTASAVSMYIFDNGKITNAIINAQQSSPEQINVLLKKYGVIDNA